MDLTSDNLFRFILKKYKYRESKQKKKIKLDKNKLNNKKTEEISKQSQELNIKKFSKGLIINSSNISNFVYNSTEPFINECYKNLEYLSITDNYIKNIDFILKLPNLFYLDLYHNPLEDLTALNNKNIFGYLRLSIEKYNEKKILNIRDLHCGILDIEIKQKKYLKIFNTNNNHICMLNGQIQYFIDIIKRIEEKTKINSLKKKNISKNDVSSISGQSNSNSDITNSEIQKDQKDLGLNLAMNTVNASLNLNFETKKEFFQEIPEKPVEKIIQTNPFLLKIKKFFEEYEQEIRNNLGGENKKFYDKRRKTISLLNTEFLKSKNFEENMGYLQSEKEKLILVFNIYKKLTLFNKERNNNIYYIGNIGSIFVNKNIDNIYIKEIQNCLDNQSLKIRASIIILISLAFYIIGVISEKMVQALIEYILIKYYGFEENKNQPNFSNLGNIHYLTFYYSTFDYFYKRIMDLEKTINIDEYKDILNILKMEKLIIKSNILYKKLKENQAKNNNLEFSLYKRHRINNEIHSIKDLNIAKEFLILIQFLSDYIIFEKIEELLINKSYPGEYSYLIELKETFEEKEIQINNTKFLSSLSLSALKFEKNKKERIYNRFYFEKDNIKKIKNKEFKNYLINNDVNRSTSMLNLNTSIINSNIFNNSKSNFNNYYNKLFNNNEYNDYNKSDDIDVDECFYIDKIRKHRTMNNSSSKRKTKNLLKKRKRNNKLNNKQNIKKEFETSNENSLEPEDFKLPSIQLNQNQLNDDNEFLKKMVFNPEFLSQQARNILKIEKLTKKFSKRKLGNNKSYKINKKIKSQTKFKSEDFKHINSYENDPWLIRTAYDKDNNKFKKHGYNRTRMNYNLDSSSENTNQNNYIFNSINYNNIDKIPFNQTNYARYNYQSQNNNINTRYINMKRAFDEKFRKKKYVVYQKDMNKELNVQYFGVPQSFPGMTLLNFGKAKIKKLSNKIKFFRNKKSPNKNDIKKEIKEEKKSHKAEVISKIRETVKNNYLRNARRVAPLMYQ